MKKINILLFLITGIILYIQAICPAGEVPFKDLTNIYPKEQKDSSYYLLYIDNKPFKSPYIEVENPMNKNEIIYYFPAGTLLDSLGTSGTYDKKNDKLIINDMEAPKYYGIIGRDLKTNEKILYLSAKNVINFLKLPLRIVNTPAGISIYTKTLEKTQK